MSLANLQGIVCNDYGYTRSTRSMDSLIQLNPFLHISFIIKVQSSKWFKICFDMTPPLEKIWLYHITHIDNLAAILVQHHWLAHNLIQPTYTNIAHQNIQTRRHTKHITCNTGGVLHDYVPFYFCRRSPMLYAIHKGTVAGYTGTQQDVIYLVANLADLQSSRLTWVFTDGHAAMGLSDFYTDIKDLNQIDWNLMECSQSESNAL